MNSKIKRIAINVGGGFVPGLNAVITGATLAAHERGWEIVGIRDGFEGLLFPERYPEGGLLALTPSRVAELAGTTGCLLGTAARSDPFRVGTVDADGMAHEVDRSDELLRLLAAERIDAVVSVVSARALGILWRLSRKGLPTVCVPKSIENDVPATALSFGFNSALSFVADSLERIRQAAQSVRRICVVEVPGANAGWLALQAGMAAGADAVLIPEIPYDLDKVAASLRERAKAGRPYGLVVAATGAVRAMAAEPALAASVSSGFKASLSPASTGEGGSHVIETGGRLASELTLEIQRLTDQETFSLVLGDLAKGGAPTVVDRQLGLGYGVGAVRALSQGQSGSMVVFQPPDLKFVPLSEAINRFRTVPPDGEFVQIARALGISLGS
ncbi:MAG TPA: 6-phosphofructokinase [Thermoanaerobaculia bacterium]|nr:6-phosphofructokinase [Thermoanaerobaculia bacterium]